MKTKAILLVFFLWFQVFAEAKPLEVTVEAKGAILIDANSGKVLFEKNGYTSLYPASMTKVATALYVLDKHKEKLGELVNVSSEALKSLNSEEKRRNEYRTPAYYLEEGMRAIVKRGDRENLQSLVTLMLVASANDAANVVAETVGGTIPRFMDLLNQYLKEMGCEKTCFRNPHGFHDPAHVTTPYEMAQITRKALQIKEFCKIVSSLDCSYQNASFSQTNRLLKKGRYFYPYALGVKTGYTSLAGYNLVAAAEKGGRKLIAVLMGNEENIQRYLDARHLFEAAFDEKKVQKKLLKAPKTFQVKVEGAKTLLATHLQQDLNIEFYPSEEEAVEVYLHWKDLSLPIAKGKEIAALEILSSKKELLQSVPLYANEEVSPTLLFRCQKFFHSLFGREAQKDAKIPKS